MTILSTYLLKFINEYYNCPLINFRGFFLSLVSNTNKIKKLLLILFFTSLSFGQTKEEMELCIAFQTKSFYSNIEAENALDKILSVTGLKKNFTLTPCDGIDNAIAVSLKGERYILYDKDFMNDVGDSSSNIAILAHEIGHHLNNHARDITMYIGGVIEPDSKEVSRRHELEADEFAGFVMARLGYSLEEAKQPFYKISNNNDDSYSTHPSRDKRLAIITKGYNDGKVVTKEKIVYVTKEVEKTKNNSIDKPINNEIENIENLEETESYWSKITEIFNDFVVSYNIALTADQYKKRGDLKSKKRDYPSAIKDYDRAIESDPDYIDAYIARAEAKDSLRDYNSAKADFEKALKLEPYNAKYYAKFGDFYAKREEYSDAYVKFKRASELDSENAELFLKAGKALFRRNLGSTRGSKRDYDGAIEDFTKAIELDPDYTNAYVWRGFVKLEVLDDYNGSIADYSKAIELKPDYAGAYNDRGYSKYYLGDKRGACDDWKRAASLGHKNAAKVVREDCN